MSWRNLLNKAKNVALPTIGFALGGPAGAAAGGALAGGIGYGRPKAKRIATGAAMGGAAGGLASGMGLAGGQGLGALGSSAKAAAMDPRATLGGLFTGGGGQSEGNQSIMGRLGSSITQPQVLAGIAQGAFGAYEGGQDREARERERLEERGFSREEAEAQRQFLQGQSESERMFREQQAAMDRALRDQELQMLVARDARQAQAEEEERQRRQYIATMVAPLFQQAAQKKGLSPSAFGM